jgi:hypothetical protein
MEEGGRKKHELNAICHKTSSITISQLLAQPNEVHIIVK